MLKWLGGVPFVGLNVLAVLFVGMLLWNYLFPPSPSQQFQTAFGFAPPGDVKNLQAHSYVFGDSAQKWLAFSASPSTIQKIVKLGFKQSKSSYGRAGINQEAPTWWPQQTPNYKAAYYTEFRLKQFSTSEDEWIYWNPSSGQTYYHYDGID